MIGHIVEQNKDGLLVSVPYPSPIDEHVKTADVRLLDGRRLSSEQRKKAYAMFNDISLYTGYVLDEVKELMKGFFIERTGVPYFSLSDVDMTTARGFIDYLVEFVLTHDIPCQDNLLDRAEDVERYLYICLVHRRCCICGRKAYVHHVDTVGSGRNRDDICHYGMRAEALCWRHHGEAHTLGRKSFDEKYHVFGVRLDEYLCQRLGLGKDGVMQDDVPF